MSTSASGTPVLVVGAVVDALSSANAGGCSSIHPLANVHADAAGASRAGPSGQPCVHVTTRTRNSHQSTEVIDVDAAYAPTVAARNVLGETVTPLVRAVVQGVSACLLVTGNCESAARHWFDATPGLDGGALAFVATALFAEIGARSVAATASGVPGGAAFGARVLVSAVAVADSGPTLLDLLSPAQFPAEGAVLASYGGGGGAGAGGGPLSVINDDFEGALVAGALAYGPVEGAAALCDLLRSATASYSAISNNAGKGWSRVMGGGGGVEGGDDEERDGAAAFEPAVSCVVRILVSQTFSAASAAALGGGAQGAVSGFGCVRADGTVEVRSTLLLVCAPSAAFVLHALAESAALARMASAGGRDTATSEVLFPTPSRDASRAALEEVKTSEARARSRLSEVLAQLSNAAGGAGDASQARTDALVPSQSITAIMAAELDGATAAPSLHPLSSLLGECFGARLGGAAAGPAPWFSVVLCGLRQEGVAPQRTLRVLHWLQLLRTAATFPLIDTLPTRALLATFRRSMRLLRTALRGAPLSPLAAEEALLRATREALDGALDSASLKEEMNRLRASLAAAPTRDALASAEAEARDLRATLTARTEELEEALTREKLATKAASLAGAPAPETGELAESRRRRGALIDYALALRRKVALLTPDDRERATLEALELAMGSIAPRSGGAVDPLLVESRLLDEAAASIGTRRIPPPGEDPSGHLPSLASPYVNATTGEYASYAEVTARARSSEAAARAGSSEVTAGRETLDAMRTHMLAARDSLKAARDERERLKAALLEADAAARARADANSDQRSLLDALDLLKAHAASLAEKVTLLEGERTRLRAALHEAHARVSNITDVALKQGPMAAAAAAAATSAAFEGASSPRRRAGGGANDRSARRGGDRRRGDGDGADDDEGSGERGAGGFSGGGGGGSIADLAHLSDRAVASQSAANTMLAALEVSEKRCIELLGANAALAGQVDALRSQSRALVVKYEAGLTAAKLEIEKLRAAASMAETLQQRTFPVAPRAGANEGSAAVVSPAGNAHERTPPHSSSSAFPLPQELDPGGGGGVGASMRASPFDTGGRVIASAATSEQRLLPSRPISAASAGVVPPASSPVGQSKAVAAPLPRPAVSIVDAPANGQSAAAPVTVGGMDAPAASARPAGANAAPTGKHIKPPSRNGGNAAPALKMPPRKLPVVAAASAVSPATEVSPGVTAEREG